MGASQPLAPSASATGPAATGPSPADAEAAPWPVLRRARVGVVPIVWNNADLPGLTPLVDADTVLDEIARLGYAGTQTGVGFPTGPALRDALRRRNVALAEVYAALPGTVDGPGEAALDAARSALDTLDAADGEVLVAAFALNAGRQEVAGRAAADGTPRLTADGWRRLADLLAQVGREAQAHGRRLAFHPHAGTFVETPDEVARFAAETDPELVGICLDVGHYTVGGGDPVAALGDLGERVTHVHLKDVAAGPLEALRDGRIGGFLDALRARIFVELGAGVVDVAGILRILARRDYAGWIMLEQDTTWLPPSESAAISRRVLDYAVRTLARPAA